MSRRRGMGTVLAIAAVALAIAGARHTLDTPGQHNAPGSSGAAPAAPHTGGAALPAQAPGPISARAARAALTRLPVLAARPHRPGYQRGCKARQACSFGPAWTDNSTAPGAGNSCDTRNDVLHAQMTHVVLRAGSGCIVESGRLADPYTGKTINFTRGSTTSARVQVDHAVPLALAYDLGAWAWTPQQRTAYANDEALVLVAVDGPANEKKSDAGPADWMPVKSDWCAYDARFVAVLSHYRLAITAADKSAITNVLTHCPGA